MRAAHARARSLLHVVARLALHARTATLRLQATWPWAGELATAFAKLKHSRPRPAGPPAEPQDDHH